MITNHADMINAFFEFGGGLLNWWNVWVLYKDKDIKGVFWPAWAFFGVWGLWNLYFYSYYDAMWSWIGGLFIVSANIVWVWQAIHYKYGWKTLLRGVR